MVSRAGSDAKPWAQERKRAWRQRKYAVQPSQVQSNAKASIRAQAPMEPAKPDQHADPQRKGFPVSQGLTAEDGYMKPWEVVPLGGVGLVGSGPSSNLTGCPEYCVDDRHQRQTLLALFHIGGHRCPWCSSRRQV